MTRAGLIFDWRKSEGSFRDKLIAFILVSIAFTVAYGAVGIRFVAPRDGQTGSASILRFRDDDLGRSWMLAAEEGGPFPGRLELDGYESLLASGSLDGRISWHDYRSELRPIGGGETQSLEKVSPKGIRVFPTRKRIAAQPDAETPLPRKLLQTPVFTPYDSAALAWMPEGLPDFVMPEGLGNTSAGWHLAVNLREDGTVREAIPLAGGDDAGQAFIEEWLRGIRFKGGSGDRWMGLLVEFVNLPEDENEPE